MLGASDGSQLIFNPNKNEVLEEGQKNVIMQEEIGHISFKGGSVVLAGSQGRLARYGVVTGDLYPSGDPDQVTTILNPYGGVASLQMDEKNDEGIIGTTKGYICYIQFSEKVLIPLVSKVDSGMETIRHVDYDSFNPKVFMTSCGDRTGKVKLYTSSTIDSICEFSDVDLGPIAFITYAPKSRRQRLIGHQNGYVKVVDVEKLGTEAIYQIDIEEGE